MIIKKIVIGFLIALLAVPAILYLVFVIANLYNSYVVTHSVYPQDYPNSEWVSEDGMVHLKVDEQGQIYGTVSKENETFEILVNRPPYERSIVAHMDYKGKYQRWKIKSFKEDKFVIKVYQIHEYITIFEDGATITFYRIDTPLQVE